MSGIDGKPVLLKGMLLHPICYHYDTCCYMILHLVEWVNGSRTRELMANIKIVQELAKHAVDLICSFACSD